jgi:peptidoglycan/LPS O-acetylase OafA/YrhL
MSTAEGSRLSPRLVASLDCSRALAAAYVVAHHAAKSRGLTDGIGILLRFGQEAVLIFFLLSGFVIFANEHHRVSNTKAYYLRRVRRIYPALVVAMIVSTLISLDNHSLSSDFNISSLIGTFFNLQDVSALKPGVIVDPYLGNDPLWSLSYEVIFYIAFPFVIKIWLWDRSIANHLVGFSCCLSYLCYLIHPNHFLLVWSYYLIWWCGAMAAKGYLEGSRNFWSIGVSLYWLILLILIAAAAVPFIGYRGIGVYPALPLRHFAIALVLLVAIFGPMGRYASTMMIRVSRAGALLASVSYGLYVLHYPLLVDWHRAEGFSGGLIALLLLGFTSWFADRWLNQQLPRVQ